MIRRNLLQRVKRLEALGQPRFGSPIKTADPRLIRQIYAAKIRMGLPGWEAFAPTSQPGRGPVIPVPTFAERMVARLQEGRRRMSQKNELARQNAAATAALEGSEITEA